MAPIVMALANGSTNGPASKAAKAASQDKNIEETNAAPRIVAYFMLLPARIPSPVKYKMSPESLRTRPGIGYRLKNAAP
jgi:hypothetical protein